MLPNTLTKGFDKGRLRNLLTLIFLALAVPTAVLIWQAYSQLKWEAFHQSRGIAEELTRRIDARLIDMVNTADARSFGDYTFLVVTGDPRANFVQRSPLSAYPVTADLPGVLGYFQVDSDGTFSTPLLPPSSTAADTLGIGRGEYDDRLQLAQKIQAVLADNRLVRSRPELSRERKLFPKAGEVAVEQEQASDGDTTPIPDTPAVVLELDAQRGATLARGLTDSITAVAPGEMTGDTFAGKDDDDKPGAMPLETAATATETYSQQVFDQLNATNARTPQSADTAGNGAFDETTGKITQAERRLNTIGKVSDLSLDAEFQKKSESIERDEVSRQRRAGGRPDAPVRSKRREKIALPESVQLPGPAGANQKVAAKQTPSAVLSTPPADLRISTFESEIDPLEFSLLDSGHFVLFRKVWRNGERYIQGLVIDQYVFTEAAIGAHFMETALSDTTNLIIGYQDDVIHTLSSSGTDQYSSGTAALDGALLFQSRLSAPLDRLELIFSIKRLPAGPGASVLGWLTLVLAIVFAGGFVALYRLGSSQINLARQQQDFVSAINHELKTPLTSIRMYGEMLKEGWADEDKRQGYYEFIHDESERLTRLISNVLQLAKITRSEPQLDLKSTKVAELASNIESKITNQVESAGFELKFDRDNEADRFAIMIDDDCFAQIIINLVDNAIKFSKNAAKKSIEISSKHTNDNRIAFSVRDFGPGIPKNQMKKIFKLFYRSESELTRETVGTGIGLAIVHQLTLAMNGKVDVLNKEPGVQFSISFPVC